MGEFGFDQLHKDFDDIKSQLELAEWIAGVVGEPVFEDPEAELKSPKGRMNKLMNKFNETIEEEFINLKQMAEQGKFDAGGIGGGENIGSEVSVDEQRVHHVFNSTLAKILMVRGIQNMTGDGKGPTGKEFEMAFLFLEKEIKDWVVFGMGDVDRTKNSETSDGLWENLVDRGLLPPRGRKQVIEQLESMGNVSEGFRKLIGDVKETKD